MTARIVDVHQGVLSKNDALAAELRQNFHTTGVTVLNLVSSPGAGKTALLERTLADLLTRGRRAAALVGDLATENDARRLARSGAPVRQIVTAGICHLEAEMVATHLAGWDLTDLDFLFIENVGNLVCPASYDLGEDARVVLLSTTEGEDKPLKYPPMFQSAHLAVVTKIDLAGAVEFDRTAAYGAIHAVRPGMPIIETSARTGKGIDAWLSWLEALAVSPAAPSPA